MDNNSLKLTTDLLPGFVILVYIINLFFFLRVGHAHSSLHWKFSWPFPRKFFSNGIIDTLALCILFLLLCCSLICWLSGFLLELSEAEDEDEDEE